MTRLLMLVEGQSEEIFVKHTLAPHLAQHGVYVQPPIVLWTKRLPSGGGFRGGVSNWNQILRSLRPLTHDGDAWVSTLLDFYGLPEDFPGLQEALGAGAAHENVAALQARFAAELNHQRFIPFLALHEFEAWLFSAPDAVAAHFGKAHLRQIAYRCTGCRCAGADQPRCDHAPEGAAARLGGRLQGNVGWPDASREDRHRGGSRVLPAF